MLYLPSSSGTQTTMCNCEREEEWVCMEHLQIDFNYTIPFGNMY